MSGALTVLVSERRIRLPSAVVRVIVRLPTLSPLPGSAASTLGLMNLRGSVIPVLSTQILLGIPHALTDHPLVVVVDRGHRRFALVIDEALEFDSEASGETDIDRLFAPIEGAA